MVLRLDFDALSTVDAHGIFPELLAEHTQYLRSNVMYHDLYSICQGRRIQLRQIVTNEVAQFSRELHPGRSATDNSEAEQCITDILWGCGQRSQFETFQDSATDPTSIGNIF